MITIKPYTPKIYLIDQSGVRIKTWNTALRCAIELPAFLKSKSLYDAFLDYIGAGNKYTPSIPHWSRRFDEFNFPYLLIDEENNTVTYSFLRDVKESIEKQVPRTRYIPGTKVRGRHRDYLRYPKTLPLLKLAVSVFEEEGEPEYRANRRKNYIKTAWDDTARTLQRSWKKHRKTQYK